MKKEKDKKEKARKKEKGKIIMFKKKFGRFELEKRICENGLMNEIIKEKYNLCPFQNLLG